MCLKLFLVHNNLLNMCLQVENSQLVLCSKQNWSIIKGNKDLSIYSFILFFKSFETKILNVKITGGGCDGKNGGGVGQAKNGVQGGAAGGADQG